EQTAHRKKVLGCQSEHLPRRAHVSNTPPAPDIQVARRYDVLILLVSLAEILEHVANGMSAPLDPCRAEVSVGAEDLAPCALEPSLPFSDPCRLRPSKKNHQVGRTPTLKLQLPNQGSRPNRLCNRSKKVSRSR